MALEVYRQASGCRAIGFSTANKTIKAGRIADDRASDTRTGMEIRPNGLELVRLGFTYRVWNFLGQLICDGTGRTLGHIWFLNGVLARSA
jgi:hypothetical protein